MAKPEVVSLLQPPLVDLSSLNGVPRLDIVPVLEGNFETEVTSDSTRSIGFRLKLSEVDPDYFLKIYYQTPILRSDLLRLISSSKNPYQFTFEQISRLREETHPTELYHMMLTRQVEQQAAAHVISHQLRPEFVIALHAIWLYQQTPVGYTTEFVEGKPITMAKALQKSGESLRTALAELANHGVSIDPGLNHLNAIKTSRRKIKLVDLDYDLPRL